MHQNILAALADHLSLGEIENKDLVKCFSSQTPEKNGAVHPTVLRTGICFLLQLKSLTLCDGRKFYFS